MYYCFVYNIPIALGDVPVALLSVDELKKAAEDNIGRLKKDLEHITSGKLKIYTEARLGNVIDELEEVCKKVQPFAVVMGTTGLSAVERTLFGSNTLTAIKHLTCPVVCVPPRKESGQGVHKIGGWPVVSEEVFHRKAAADIEQENQKVTMVVILDFALVEYGIFHAEAERAVLLLEHDHDTGLAFLPGHRQLALEVAQLHIKEVFLGIVRFCIACSHAEHE